MNQQTTTVPVRPFRTTRQSADQRAVAQALAGTDRSVDPAPYGLYLSNQAFVAWQESSFFLWVRACLCSQIDDPLLQPMHLCGVSISFERQGPDCILRLIYPADWHYMRRLR